MATQTISKTIPKAFIWRRLHSLAGLWMVLFLMEHLLVNSQAALLLGDNARGFVDLVNSIHNLPYLQAIELLLLGFPMALHAVLGVKYLFSSQSNSHRSEGSKPDLHTYGRNRAYTMQRITSWVLLVGIILHVAKFRFLEYPDALNFGKETSYFVKVSLDKGLYTVADRLGVKLYGPDQIEQEKKQLENRVGEETLVSVAKEMQFSGNYDPQQQMILTAAQSYEQRREWVEMLEKHKLQSHEVLVVSPDFGTATLFSVRNTFKSPIYVGLYTLFVLAACFHAFNGLWTFLLTWGLVIRVTAQKIALKGTWVLMALIAFLGLAAIWGTYFLNLKS